MLLWATFVHTTNGIDSIFGCEFWKQINGVFVRVKKVLVDEA